MASLNDVKRTALGGGSINDAEVAWLITQTGSATVRSMQDLWQLYLDQEGIASGAMSTRVSLYFDSLSIPPGDANARWLNFWGSQ